MGTFTVEEKFMKKICLLLICIFISTSTVYAQKGKKGSKKRSATRVTQTGRVNRGGIERIRIVSGSIPNIRETRLASPSRFGQVSRHSFSSKGRLADVNIAELERQVAELERTQQALEADSKALEFYNDYGRSVLYAPLISGETLGFTITVVKIEGEIFGVMPSHSLYYDHGFAHLSKSFYVNIIKDGKTERVLAEVVQASPASMLDISLVKFSAESEKLFAPLEVYDAPLEMGEQLYSHGFAAGKETDITRSVNAQSFLSVRTNQAIEGNREGYCGSPILDAQGRVRAIHVGTTEHPGDIPDVSYGTHAKFIKLLVEAYHNQGKANYDLVIEGQKIATLNVDEYISVCDLFDENGKRIAQQNIPGKFSESRIHETLEKHPQAVYLNLTSRKVNWKEEQSSPKVSSQTNEILGNPEKFKILEENRGKTDKTKQQHWYNLQTKEILLERPAVIKM